LKSKSILEGRLDLKSPKSSFSSTKGVFVEFSLEVQEMFQSNFKNSEKNIKDLKENLKNLNKNQFQDFSAYNDWSDFFQSSFQDHSQYSQFLESIVEGLSARLKVFESLDIRSSEKQVKSSEKLELRANSNELKKDLNEESLLLQKQLEEKNKEIVQLKARALSKESAKEKTLTENQLLRADLLKLKADQRNFDQASKSLKETRGLLQGKDEIIENLKKKLKKQLQGHQQMQKTFEKALKDLENENSKLFKEGNFLKSSLEILTSEKEQVLFENSQLKNDLFQEKTIKKTLETFKEKDFFQSDSHLIKDLLQEIEKLKETLKKSTESHKEEVFTWMKKCKELETRFLTSQKAGVREKASHQKNKLSGNFENIMKNASNLFETLITDSRACLKNVRDIDFKSVFENSSIYEHSEKLSEKLLEQSKTILYYQNVLTRVVEVLRELKSENFALRERLFFSQNSLPLYIPVRGDPLDFAMAEFVNNLKRPLKIPFVRQDPGFYLFGSRNIKIRLLKNKPVIYAPEPSMAIDEFVNRFTREEIIKFEEQKKIDDKRIASEVSKFPSCESSPQTPALSTSAFSANRSLGSFQTFDMIPKTQKSSHFRKFSGSISNRILKKS
jgi:hypothetical protein